MTTISIVTYCRNDLDQLISTCKSIDRQIKKPYEHWIINCSTGLQIEEWLNNTEQPNYRKWVNLKGVGIIYAINNGISNCEGDVIHVLHSGDYFNNDSILNVVGNEFDNDIALQWVSGKLLHTMVNKNVELGKGFNKNKLYKGLKVCTNKPGL